MPFAFEQLAADYCSLDYCEPRKMVHHRHWTSLEGGGHVEIEIEVKGRYPLPS